MGQTLPMKRANVPDETGKTSRSDKRGASAAEAKWQTKSDGEGASAAKSKCHL